MEFMEGARGRAMGSRIVLLLSLSCLLWPGIGLAAERSCANQPEVVVATEVAALHEQICSAAEQAINFLAQYQLRPKRPIVIDLADQKIDNHGYPSYGRYEGDVDRIELMSYAAIMALPEPPLMYGEPFDPVHYSGVIAHEVAHAVVEHNLLRKKFSAAPSEYLAHATQLAVMPEERRQRVIGAMKVTPWQGGDSITNIYMAMNPGKFAVKSYLHLVSMPHPDRFVKLLLDARWFDVYVPKDLG